MSDQGDKLAAEALRRLRETLRKAREIPSDQALEISPGEFGPANWKAIAARKGLDEVAKLRGFGADWLSKQPREVQQEVDDAEDELNRLLADAVGKKEAHPLLRDLPEDPV